MRERWVAVARGDAAPDLVLKGGQVISVFTDEVFRADIAIADGYIVGVGEYEGPNQFDVAGQFVCPGFIDGHCHIESSKLSVEEFARVLVPRGTTSVVVDPHELANVLGLAGIEYVLRASENIPLGVYVKLPSCVPASPFETSAAVLEAADLSELLDRNRVIGLAEMMNYPAAIAGERSVMQKMAATGYRNIDGHAPDVTGNALNAYLISGPSSDHECTAVSEALEKRRLGMWIMLREASMIRNLVDLLPLIVAHGTENCMFVTDDREASTLLDEGHINSMVRTSVSYGLNVGDAVRLASLNVARYHGLSDLGAVAPGYKADLAILPDLNSFEPTAVFKQGRLVASAGKVLPFDSPTEPLELMHSVSIAPLTEADFAMLDPGTAEVRVIDLVPDQVITRSSSAPPTMRNGEVVADPERDLLKLAVVDRHRASGRIGIGLVRGFGLRDGAFASTVAHDAHNLIVAGANDIDMAACVRRLAQIGGGLVVSRGGAITGELPLEIAGLMSVRPAQDVAAGIESLESLLRAMGCRLATPFMYLSFLALSVIPELRVTDQGLVDVLQFKLVPLGIG